MTNTDWFVAELTDEELQELEENKGNQPSCQDDVPEGETGWGDGEEAE